MSDFKYTTTIEVRFSDLDAYGHVNNAVFFTYLETARIKLFQERFGDFLDGQLTFLVTHAECDYRLPIVLNDSLQVTVSVDQVKRSSFGFSYLIHDGNKKTFAEAKTVMVCFDPKKGKPVAIPAPIKTVFLNQ